MNNKFIFKVAELWYLVDSNSRTIESGSMKELEHHLTVHDQVLFSLQISDFIREFDKKFSQMNLPTLVDIESFIKQFWQKSKPIEQQKKWNFFKFLKENDYLPKEFIIQESINEYLLQVIEFIEKLINIQEVQELARFKEIEIPINRLIYQRQRKGIHIDKTIYPELIQQTEVELYKLKNELQLTHGIFTPDKTITQIEVLNSEGIEIRGSLIVLFKSNKGKSKKCNLFYQMLRAKSDLSALIYLTSSRGGVSRTFPNFYGFGAISSRITMREPALQNLRKSTRKIIQPDSDCELIYIDYSQFEAGILASLSDDKQLQDLYMKDIYDDINNKVWQGERDRDQAKILFYKYMYGVSFKSINENKYFKSFTALNKFKERIEKNVKETGKVGSSFGNYRILSVEDKTIALSHKIQAEAALIFKKALLRVNEEVHEADFILPMHDAALYQVNTKMHSRTTTEAKIQSIFVSVFAESCSEIHPSAKIKDFYAD